MNIVKNIEQYKHDYVFYCDPIKNNVMNDGTFIRILYSTDIFVLNGINLFISLNDVVIEKYYNKYKCVFNVPTHKVLIEQIKYIEEELLRNANIQDKAPQHNIYDQLKNGNIKIYLDSVDKPHNNLFMLKISGIWETETQYGVTYKFLKITRP